MFIRDHLKTFLQILSSVLITAGKGFGLSSSLGKPLPRFFDMRAVSETSPQSIFRLHRFRVSVPPGPTSAGSRACAQFASETAPTSLSTTARSLAQTGTMSGTPSSAGWPALRGSSPPPHKDTPLSTNKVHPLSGPRHACGHCSAACHGDSVTASA